MYVASTLGMKQVFSSLIILKAMDTLKCTLFPEDMHMKTCVL